MQNSIFDIFGNQTVVPRTTSNATKSTHGSGAISRGPVKPNSTGPAPKKVLGDLRSNVLCDVGNITNRPLPLTSKGGVKNIIPQKDIQYKAGTSFGLQKGTQPKKLMPASKVDETVKPVVLKENIVQTAASSSQPSLSVNFPDAISCGVGSFFPKHLQLTVEDIEILGNLTSFRMEPEQLVLSEISLVEDDSAVDPVWYNSHDLAVPCFVWKDPSTVPLPLDE